MKYLDEIQFSTNYTSESGSKGLKFVLVKINKKFLIEYTLNS